MKLRMLLPTALQEWHNHPAVTERSQSSVLPSYLTFWSEPTESAGRAFDGVSALAALLFVGLLVWVSGSQGDHQQQKP